MRQVGGYVLSQRIGSGGMAEVWMGHREALGASKTVAVKLLASHLATKSQYRDMFIEEARLSGLLNNSNIVQVFDFGVEDDGECYMVMEWVDGANLSELQAALWEAGRVMPVEVAMYIIGEILRALDYAHNLVYQGASTIVHRDVSPANIMVSIAGEVKLMDFGVARFATEETSGVHVKGKMRYMPPEQLQGRSKEGTVDIFALGAVLHEMLDGDRFRGAKTEEAELLGMIFSGAVPELREPGRVSTQLDELRQRMLAGEVSERIASAREALQQLRRCPGYRQASHELEALVRWYRGRDGGDAGHQTGRFAQMMPAVADTSVSRSAVAPREDSQRSRPVAPFGLRRVHRMIAAAVVAFMGLGVGCLGVGFAVSNLGAELREPQTESSSWSGALGPVLDGAEQLFARGSPPSTGDAGLAGFGFGSGAANGVGRALEAADTEPPAPADSGEPAEPGEPEPTPIIEDEPSEVVEDEPAEVVEEAPTEVVEDDEPEPAVVAQPEPKPTPRKPAEPSKPKVKHDPVDVKFAAGDFGYAYIKVGTKRFLVEPFATIKLTPGSHKVYARMSAEEKWTYFGKIEIEPKQPLRTISLTKPKGLKVSK